jgi:hypothetical protein
VKVNGTVPSGTVTVTDGSVVLGSAPLVYQNLTLGSTNYGAGSYAEIFGTAALATPGARVITATYPGDASNRPATLSKALNVN